MPNLGDPILMSATYRDASNALVDPTNVVLTITLPDQTTITPTPTHVAASGVYTYNYITTKLGHGSWAYTSDNYGGVGDSFNVSLPAATLVSVTDAKNHINYGTGTTDDTEIRAKLRTATAYVNKKCGYSIPTTVTEAAYAPVGGAHALVLTQWPVISVQSITAQIPILGAPVVSAANTVIDSNAGLITLTTGIPFYGAYTVAYTAGRQDASGNTLVPDDLQELCLEFFKWLWETQRGGGTSNRLPGLGDDDEAGGPMMLPPRVMAIESDYIRPNV